VRDDEAALTEAIIRLAKQYGRYGYRRIRAARCRRLAGERQARLSHLAPGRAQGSQEATETWASLAQ
jgi:hypothetical protein